MTNEIYILILSGLLLSGIISGLPVAFVLMGVPLLMALVGAFFGVFDLAFLAAFPSRVFGLVTNPVLVSIPLFVLMGGLLAQSGIAKRMMLTAGALFGERRGGMAYAVIIVGGLLAASTGVIAATIFMMGMIALPAMIAGNYNSRLSAGVICASGSLGQIIPPSILLILLTDQISTAYQVGRRNAGDFAPDPVSVGDLFAGAMLPGLLLVALYLLYIFIVSIVKPETCPPVQISQIEGLGDKLTLSGVMQALVAPLLLIVVVLGSILGGVATPTESAALGASGALILIALNSVENPFLRWCYYGVGIAATVLVFLQSSGGIAVNEGVTLRFLIGIIASVVLLFGFFAALVQEIVKGDVIEVATKSARQIASIILIVFGAYMLSLVFRGYGGEKVVHEFLDSLPGGTGTALFTVMLLIFLMGFILEYVEIIFIIIPIAGPPLMQAGVDPVWFAILISLNLQTSFMTPPFGYALFYLRSVAPPSVTTRDIYISIIPFVAIQLLVIGIVAAFPVIATWLPDLIYN